MAMPAKPGRGRRWISTYEISFLILEAKAYELGMVRAEKGDVGRLMDAIASILMVDTPTKKILEAVLDTLSKTV